MAQVERLLAAQTWLRIWIVSRSLQLWSWWGLWGWGPAGGCRGDGLILLLLPVRLLLHFIHVAMLLTC